MKPRQSKDLTNLQMCREWDSYTDRRLNGQIFGCRLLTKRNQTNVTMSKYYHTLPQHAVLDCKIKHNTKNPLYVYIFKHVQFSFSEDKRQNQNKT